MRNIIRGGQTSLHSFRMSLQLFITLLKISVIMIFLVNITTLYLEFDLYSLKAITVYYLSKLFCFLGLNQIAFTIKDQNGVSHIFKAQALIYNLTLIKLKNHFISTFFKGLLIGVSSSILSVFFFIYIFSIRGKKLTKEKFVRGGNIVSDNNLKSIIEYENSTIKFLPSFLVNIFIKNPYLISNIPYPIDSEYLHTIILGSTGTGKTTAILDILDQIREKGDRAIIYDKMGTFISLYYNSNKDIILNPLDNRSKSWSIFNEIRRESDYNYLAAALIPEKKSGGDPFWVEAARKVIAAFSKKIKQENPNITNQEFVDMLLKSSYKQIARFLEETDASSLISHESEKTSLSILAVLSTYISSIKYLHDNNDKFSIREWIENINNDGFLFISSRGDQHDTLKPLISTWLDVAVKSLLSIEKDINDKRKTWIIIDEVASLQQLPSLLDGLSQSRQFGGAFIVSLHSISQLKSIYGKDQTDTITSLCRNKLFFSVPDAETAEYCSENLGYKETEEIKEGISYGASEYRDGVNINFSKNMKRLVIPSEFMYMNKLQAYIKFAGDFPIAKTTFKTTQRNKLADKYIENTKPQNEEDIFKFNQERSDPNEDLIFNEIIDENNIDEETSFLPENVRVNNYEELIEEPIEELEEIKNKEVIKSPKKRTSLF